MKHKILNTGFCRIMIFARWSGKRNSVFLSLGRLIKISFLSVAYFLLNTFLLQSQTDTIKMDEIKISAYRTNVSLSNVPRMVNLISSDEISNAPVGSIHDVLRTMMNLDIRERGVYGIQSDLNIRGGSFEQNVVLINGVRMTDPQTGHFQLNLPVDMVDIQRIELLNGSSSSLYGNNAFSGAINLITGMREPNSAKISLLAGEHNLYGATVSVNLSSKNFKNYFSVSKKISDGYIQDTDFDIVNLFYLGKINTRLGEIQLQTGFLDKAFGAYSFYTPVYPNEFEQNKTWMANVKFESNTRLKVVPSIYWRRNFDKFELFRDNPPAWYIGPNYHTTNVYGGALNAKFKLFSFHSALGLDWNTESILSNKLGEVLNDTIAIRGEEVIAYTHGKTRQNISSFFENQLELGRIFLSAHFMLNWNSMFKWNFYPGLDISYALSDKIKLISTLNWSGRLPSFTELYYSDPSNQGNVDLLPEKAVTAELGTKYFRNSFIFQTAVFYRFGSDIIDWVKTNPDELWQCSNTTNMNTYGFEISVKWSPVDMANQPNFIKSLGLSYTYLSMDKSSGTYLSKYVLDYLKHSASFSITHHLYKHFLAGWQFNYQLRNGSYLPYNYENRLYEQAKDYTPVYLLDLKIAYQGNSFEAYIQLKNILNQKQQSIENVSLPGRWISAGMSLHVNFTKSKKTEN